MMKPYETIKLDHGIVIKIYPDDSAENPIVEFDCQVHVSVWHRRYDFGNNHRFKTSTDFEEYFEAQNSPENLAENPGDQIYRLPVYLYDHSGLTVNTTGFSCPWDSGQVGWVWITKQEAEERWGITDEAKVEENLRGTVKLLDHYLTGRVYGYCIEDVEGNHLDSCWGYYGDPEENVIPEAKSAADYYVKKAAENRAVVESVARRAVELFQAECRRHPAI
jgi:hypothetical protein